MASKPRIVLITGCSSGIGLSTAVLLAKDPEKRFKVYATMRNLDKKSTLETAGKEVLGETLVVRQLDVCSDESVHKTVQEILHTEGRVDVLVNNAGVGIHGVLETLSIDLMKSVFETNFFGLVRVTKAVLPNMKANNSGHIVNISSIVAFDALPFSSIYSASKFAVEGFTESIAVVLKEFNIKCILIEPGQVETQFPFNVKVQTEKTADEKSLQLRSKFENAFLPLLAALPGTTQWNQPVGEVAEIILTAILAGNPDFRYQTTEIFKAEAKKKFTDSIGFSNIEKINKRFFHQSCDQSEF